MVRARRRVGIPAAGVRGGDSPGHGDALELVETQVSRALELGKPLMMLHGDDFRELPHCRV